MSAISDYFEGDALLNYTQQRVQLNKTVKPSLSKAEKTILLEKISLLLNRDQNQARNQQIETLVQKKQAEIEEKYHAAITTSSGRAKTKFYPLDPLKDNLEVVSDSITKMIKSYSSWGGQRISKKQLIDKGENIGTIRDQLNSLEKQLALIMQNPIDTNIKSLIDQYNHLVELIGEYTPVNALAQGDFFEAVIAMADQLKNQEAEDIVVDTILQNITKTIVGAKIEGKQSKNTTSITISKNGAKAQGIVSQGKVDVLLTSSDKRRKKPIGISAKSYTSFKNITLESGTSMQKILMGENIKYSTAVLLGLAASENAQIFNKAKESFELLAYYKTLTGDYYGRTKATLFVLNNVRTKKVYIVEMADILNDAYNYELKNRSVFKIEPNKYYTILRGLNTYNELIAAQSHQTLKVIFSSSGTIFNRLKNTVSG